MDFVNSIMTYLPAEPDLISTLKFIGIFAACALAVGLLARIIFGKRSSLNHSISSAMGILCIYAVSIVVYTFNPYGLRQYLSPLPFVSFNGNSLSVFLFSGMQLTVICHEVLSMIILAFLVNLLDTWIPKGSKILGWYGYRFLTVALSMALHYGVTWAFNTFLPGALVTYAPMILLGLLVAMLLLGFLNIILGLVLTVVNPIIGALYTFFFSNIIGKQITKAVITTLILCAVVYVLNYLGYAVIGISAAALISYLPLIGALLVLWYLFGHVL